MEKAPVYHIVDWATHSGHAAHHMPPRAWHCLALKFTKDLGKI